MNKFYYYLGKKKVNVNITAAMYSQITMSTLILGWICYLIYAIISFPFPERFFISDMSVEMINSNQHVLLVTIYLSATLFLAMFLVNIALAGLLSYVLLFVNVYRKKNGILLVSTYKIVFDIIYTIFYIILPIIFSFFSLFFYYKKIEPSKKIENKKSYLKIKKIGLITISTIFSSILLIPILYGISLPVKKRILLNSVPIRTNDLKNSYTISENQPNTMVLYFDRGSGLLFNVLLELDYLLFKEQGSSFIQQFPEFTSYVNAISLASKTNGSNPVIKGGWSYLPSLKNTGIKVNEKSFKNYNMDEWTLSSYKTLINLLDHYNYSNISILDTPYYNFKTYQRHSNALKLQEDLRKEYPTHNINVLDSIEISKTQGHSICLSRVDEINAFRTISNKAKSNIKLTTDKDKHSSFIFSHFFITHQDYGIVQNKQYISKNNPYGINYDNPAKGNPKIIKLIGEDDLLVSIWYSIQQLKDILRQLKQLPCNRKNISNQYENTNIYIIADHGSNFKLDTPDIAKTLNYLQTYNLINSNNINYLNKIQKRDFNPLPYSIVFLRKPTKYTNDSWNKKINLDNPIETFYNNDKLINLADFIAILDSDLQKSQLDMKVIQKTFTFTNNLSYFNYCKIPTFENELAQKIFEKEVVKNFIYDPLNNKNINTRSILISSIEWVYRPKAKTFTIYDNKYFNPYKRDIANIFDISLWIQ